MPPSSFGEARDLLRAGRASCEGLTASYLEVVGRRNGELNALIHVDEDGALESARGIDRALAEGREMPLAGMVMAIKDVICLPGQPNTCGSRMLRDFRPLVESTAVGRLRSAGAVFVGKANCDEFAMGSSNENSFYGAVRNPADATRVPGGSSGGSAAAVAAGMCNVALGSDTGGSIRQPAAFCGVVGLKPTYGRVSRYGLVAYASSLDSIGPLATTTADAAAALRHMAGVDDLDSTSAPVDVPDFEADAGTAVAGLRVGIPTEFSGAGLDPEIASRVRESVETLREAGATVREVSLPHTDYGVATYYILATAEASSNLARYDGVRYGYRAGNDSGDVPAGDLTEMYTRTRTTGFGREVKRRVMLGTFVLSSGYYDAYYSRAQRVRTLIRRDFDRAFQEVDVLLTPATPTAAFDLGSKLADPLEMYLSDVFTVTANLAGVPGLVVPSGMTSDRLPVGVQLLGRHFDESTLLAAGSAIMNGSSIP